MGMIASTLMSHSRNLISKNLVDRAVSTVMRIMPINFEIPPIDDAWELMLHDKKIRKGRMVFILIKDIGDAVCVNDVTKDELALTLEAMKECCNG